MTEVWGRAPTEDWLLLHGHGDVPGVPFVVLEIGSDRDGFCVLNGGVESGVWICLLFLCCRVWNVPEADQLAAEGAV